MDNNSTLYGENPYFPPRTAMDDYVPNTLSAPVLVSCFAAGAGTILTTTYAIISRLRPGLSRGDTFAALWFALCGCIHLFFEGYFARNYDQMPSRLSLFGQLWKEYSLSDSRYLTRDSFVVTMEFVTAAFWGPMSFACVAAVVASHPMRHPLQLVISLGQLYGDVLYYATCTFDALVHGVIFCRPEAFYFWAYYFLCNSFWIAIPLALIVSSVRATRAAFARVQELERTAKVQ